MSIRTIIVSTVAVLLVGGAVYPLLSRREADRAVQAARGPAPLPVVQVAAAELRPLSRSRRLSGTLKSGSEAALSPKQGGRVAAVYVRNGDPVRRGQVLVRLDASDLQGQVDTAAAGMRAARAQLDKALAGEKLKRVDIERRIREAKLGLEQAKRQVEKAEAGIELQRKANEAQVQKAQAGVEAAKADLARARRGARPQQREQVQIQLRQAERGLETARKNFEDVQYLHQKGALPRIQLDQAQEGVKKAEDGVAQARAQLSLLEAGATAEDIQAAESQVRIAEAGLAAARSAAERQDIDRADLNAARGQVEAAENGLRAAEASRGELETIRSDIRAARAAYEQAANGHRLARALIAGLSLVSPVDGVVSTVSTNVGEIAGPGRPLVTVVGTSGVFMEAGVPARVLAELSPGMQVSVTVDALPGETFPGVIRSIGATAGPDGRTFPVQVDLHAPPGKLKPGGLARAEVRGSGEGSAVAVPAEALQVSGETSTVWVIRDETATPVTVEVPLQEGGKALVRGDIRSGDLVAVAGHTNLKAGERVEIRRGEEQ